MKTRSKYPLVRLPEKTDRLLFILCEDLRNNKFFNHLAEVGFDDSGTRSYFTSMVLDMVFHDSSDELMNLYLNLLDDYSRKLKGFERDQIAKQGLKLYIALMIEKGKIKALSKKGI